MLVGRGFKMKEKHTLGSRDTEINKMHRVSINGSQT